MIVKHSFASKRKLLENEDACREINVTESCGNAFVERFCSFVYIQYFGKFLPINKNKTIESVLAGSKLH